MTPASVLLAAAAALEAQASALRRQAAALDGDALTPVAADILTSEHITVAQLAGRLRTSEKTARAIGVAAGARFQIGGRVLFDLAAVRRHITSANYRVLPCSSLSDDEQIADNSVDDE
jgi:hypothetical protein